MQQPQLIFKIIVIGPPYVGKTSMLFKYIKGQFLTQYNVTVGVEFSSKSVNVSSQTSVNLQVWDTAGLQTYKSLVRTFYKGAAAAFLVYSIDSEDSFKALKGWAKEIKQNAHQQCCLFLIGSKLDLEAKRQVPKQKAALFLKEIGGIYYVESSAKTGQNINQLFDKAANIMYKRFKTSGSFRNLVKPALASGFFGGAIDQQQPQKGERRNSVTVKISNNEEKNKENEKKKSCC